MHNVRGFATHHSYSASCYDLIGPLYPIQHIAGAIRGLNSGQLSR